MKTIHESIWYRFCDATHWILDKYARSYTYLFLNRQKPVEKKYYCRGTSLELSTVFKDKTQYLFTNNKTWDNYTFYHHIPQNCRPQRLRSAWMCLLKQGTKRAVLGGLYSIVLTDNKQRGFLGHTLCPKCRAGYKSLINSRYHSKYDEWADE